MRFILLAILAVFAPLTTAQAELSLDSVRSQLATRDFNALEHDFSKAHAAARSTGDSRLLRQINGQIFSTVNDERLSQLRDWQAAYPASPYAATALAWTYNRRGFAQRGAQYAQNTATEALRAHEADMKEAGRMTRIALKASEDYRPALDIALLLSRSGNSPLPTSVLLAQSQKLGPDYRSLYLGLVAYSPNWGGSQDQMTALCNSYADAIPGYDRELCGHEALFLVGDVPALLASLDHITATRRPPAIDPTLRYVYTSYVDWQNRPEALDELKRLLLASLDCETDFYQFQDELFAIWSNYPGGTEIAAELTAQQFEVTLACLKDNPQDPRLLANIAGFAYGAEVPEPALSQARAMAQSAWQESLKLGAYQPEVWKAGRQIARRQQVDGADGWWDFQTQERFYRNEIAYSGHDLRQIDDYRMYLNFVREDGARFAPDSPEAKLLARNGVTQGILACKIWRVKRITDAICDPLTGSVSCNHIISAEQDREAAFLEKGPLCLWERFAPVEALMQAPLPISDFVSASQ